jgi:hypothetical protein
MMDLQSLALAGFLLFLLPQSDKCVGSQANKIQHLIIVNKGKYGKLGFNANSNISSGYYSWINCA